jgi:hypothetical protein
MHAILIANDASSWYESGSVQDVTIHNNFFENSGFNSAPENYVISIAPENHVLVPSYMVHRNIRIENNTFKVYDYPVLAARSTENLIFTGNKIIRTDFRKAGENRPLINLNACRKVIIKGNHAEGFEDPSIRLQNMEKKELSTDMIKSKIIQ